MLKPSSQEGGNSWHRQNPSIFANRYALLFANHVPGLMRFNFNRKFTIENVVLYGKVAFD